MPLANHKAVEEPYRDGWYHIESGLPMVIEGTLVAKEEGLSAVFEGTLQPFVACQIARLDHPEIHSEARIVGLEHLDVPIGGTLRLEVTRTITDRRAGVVRFDCKLL